MILVIDTAASRVLLDDPDNFRQLHAEVRGGGDAVAALQGTGELDADGAHAWVRVDRLRALGRPQDAQWQQQFDAMLRYAAGKGWLDARAEKVRVHLKA